MRAGDLRYGYQAVADNLPNDPKIHAETGSKKIFFKNLVDPRVGNVRNNEPTLCQEYEYECPPISL